MVKYYYASHHTIEKEPKKVLEILEKTEFDGLEVLATGKHKLTRKNKSIFKNRPNDFSISVHAPYKDINLADENEKVRENNVDKVKNIIKDSVEIGADHITIHPGYFKNKDRREIAWKQNLKSFREISETAEEEKMYVGIENMPEMPRIIGKHPSEIFGVVDSVENDYFSVSFDIGHANTTGHVYDFLDEMDKISHLHFHDNFGKKDQHLAVGEGNIDFEKICSKIRDYSDIIVFESRNVKEGLLSLKRTKKQLK